MQKKKISGLAFFGLLILIAVTGMVVVSGLHSKTKETHKLTNHDHFSHTLHEACTIFTRTDAAEILGNDAQKSSDPVYASTEDMKVSNCSYSANGKTIKVLVNAPLTDEGIESNEAVFGDRKPADAIKVEGYGSDAYWWPTQKSLNIFREHSWVQVSVSDANSQADLLKDSRAVADKIMARI